MTKELLKFYEVPSMNVRDLTGHTDDIDSVRFSPTEDILTTAGDNTIKLWEAATGKLLHTFNRYLAGDNRFSPDGKLLAVIIHDEIKVYDVKTRAIFKSYRGEKKAILGDISFDKNGKIFEAGLDGSSCRWDIKTGNVIARDIEPLKRSIYYSPDVKLYVECSVELGNGPKMILDHLKGTMEQCRGRINSRGNMLATYDGKVAKIWQLSFDSILHRAIKAGNPDVVNMIIERFPYLSFVVHPDGYTTLELADKYRHNCEKQENANRNLIYGYLTIAVRKEPIAIHLVH